MKFLYKARKSLLPCFLITTAIGWTYAFSLFAGPLCERLGASEAGVRFAFCLNIFFLGMGAAFFGSLVEKNIKRAAWLSTALLFSGLCLSGLAARTGSIWLLYAGCGVLCGLAEGVGYVTPVKNLLLWFGRSRHKALVMAVSIVSFGLGSSICSYMFKYAFPRFGIENVFFFFAAVYLAQMSAGALMIDKPLYARMRLKARAGAGYSAVKYAKDPYFRRCWIFMFMNIAMGLVVIGQCAGMLKSGGLGASAVVLVMMLCGLANGGGRLLFPALSDYFGKRVDAWLCALALEVLAIGLVLLDARAAPLSFIVVNACYGCGFAMAPAVLLERYGGSELSFCHGLLLSAWGFASLFAFGVSAFVLSGLGLGQDVLFCVLGAVYALTFASTLPLRRNAV